MNEERNELSDSSGSALPKLRETVRIKFWSLRNGIGAGYGVIFDIDTEVERDAYRTRCNEDWCEAGWRWQIRGLRKLEAWDGMAEADQECLDNLEDPANGVEILSQNSKIGR